MHFRDGEEKTPFFVSGLFSMNSLRKRSSCEEKETKAQKETKEAAVCRNEPQAAYMMIGDNRRYSPVIAEDLFRRAFFLQVSQRRDATLAVSAPQRLHVASSSAGAAFFGRLESCCRMTA